MYHCALAIEEMEHSIEQIKSRGKRKCNTTYAVKKISDQKMSEKERIQKSKNMKRAKNIRNFAFTWC